MTKEFKVISVQEVTSNNGNKFTAYKTIGKNGKKMDIRFTKSCDPTKLPTEPCIVVVEEANANVDTSRQYPVLWIKAIEELKPIERKNNIDDFFD